MRPQAARIDELVPDSRYVRDIGGHASRTLPTEPFKTPRADVDTTP
jgi:hypothetical protein